MLAAADGAAVADSLGKTHNSFETPCGSYAHFKLTRYLLRVSRDSRYGDSMERTMYNAVLGAKPLQPDGRAFYYSDYNFKGKKVYSDHRWACCSGTLPQVAADYRINIYFHDPLGVFVNLYIPSTVRWMYGGVPVELTQSSAYPFESSVQFEVQVSKPSDFAIRFRIPEWANGASVSVNGRRSDTAATLGTFAEIRRTWKNGDHVELDLPMTLQLEAVNMRHPETVALLFGPVVLFAVTDNQSAVSQAELLAARRLDAKSWQVKTADVPLKMLPFAEIREEPYSTYLRVT